MITLVITNNKVQTILEIVRKTAKAYQQLQTVLWFCLGVCVYGCVCVVRVGKEGKFLFLKTILNPKANEEIKIC